MDAVASALSKARVPSAPPLKVLAIDTNASNSYIADGNGAYDKWRRSVGVTSPSERALKQVYQPLGSQKLFSTSYAVTTAEASVEATAVHEYGHHVHMTAGDGLATHDARRAARTAVDKVINDTYRSEVTAHRDPRATTKPHEEPAGRAPTMYARAIPSEFWAESFSLYHTNPEWLRANKRPCYDMVVQVLKLLGVP